MGGFKAVRIVTASLGVMRGSIFMWRAIFTAVLGGISLLLQGCPTGGGPATLTLSPSSLDLEVGQSATLTATSSATLDTFTWTSNRTDVATVSPQGRVSAVAVGSAQITVTSRRTELTDTTAVTVAENLPPAITLGEPSAAATRQGPVTFEVSYAGAEAITLAAADITLNTTGTATAVLGDPVTTGEGVRSIPLNTIAGDGTLSISIAAGTATDTEGNAAPAAGPSAPVTVDNTEPTLEISAPSASTTSTGPVDYLVNYAGADTITLTTADVLVNGTGTVAATLADVAATSETERTVSFSSIDGDGTLGISIAAATAADQAGNTAAAVGPSGEVVVDNTPPTATISAPSPLTTKNGPLTFRVTYDGASAITLAESDVQINGSAGVVAVLDEIEATSDNQRTIRFSTVAGDGTLGIALAAGTATDAAGNQAPATGPSATAIVDNTPPTVTIGFPSANTTNAGPIVYPVTYEGASDVTLTAADVTFNRTGTANAQVTAITSAEGGPYHITLGSVIGNGTLGISLAAATATDAAGNVAAAAGPSATFQVENVGPSLLIGPPSSANTFEEPVSYTITYADATAITLAPADVTLNSPDGVTATIAVTGSGATERTVTLSAFSGLGEVTISIAAGTAQNDAADQAPAAGPSALFSVNPLLQPGSGFTAPTPQPDPIGDPGAPGIDAKAIARWDVVPYQTFDGYFNVGVVAFHINDIDRVAFSVEGGPWQAVREMTLNPETDVVEYWIGLDARDFEDGPIEVRAVAYPKVGIPRVLGGNIIARSAGEHSLFLNSNATGTLNPVVRYVSQDGSNLDGDGTIEHPFASVKQAAISIQNIQSNADNGIIYLLPGNYSFSGEPYNAPPPVTENAWLTIAAAPETDRNQVTISQGGSSERINASRVRLQGLTLSTGLVSSLNLNHPAAIWFQDCILTSEGRLVDTMFAGASMWRGGIYLTDSTIRDTMNGPFAVELCRNVEVLRIGSDAFQYAYFIVNSRVEGINALDSGAHPDVWQLWVNEPLENYIVYNLIAVDVEAQGIFVDGSAETKDIAIVNVLIEKPGASADAGFSQWSVPVNHLLVQNFTSVQAFIWRTDKFRNMSVSHSVFARMGGTQNIDPNWLENNHFIETEPIGHRATQGPAGFVDPHNNDFRPNAQSPLNDRVVHPLTSTDASGVTWRLPSAIGAFQSHP